MGGGLGGFFSFSSIFSSFETCMSDGGARERGMCKLFFFCPSMDIYGGQAGA